MTLFSHVSRDEQCHKKKQTERERKLLYNFFSFLHRETVNKHDYHFYTWMDGGFGAGLLFLNGLFRIEVVFSIVGELDDSSERTGLKLLPSMLPLLTLPSYCNRDEKIP